MTQLLDQALETVRQLPPKDQDEIARDAASCARRPEPEEIDPAHLPAVMEGFEQAKRSEFASGAEVEASLRLFDL